MTLSDGGFWVFAVSEGENGKDRRMRVGVDDVRVDVVDVGAKQCSHVIPSIRRESSSVMTQNRTQASAERETVMRGHNNGRCTFYLNFNSYFQSRSHPNMVLSVRTRLSYFHCDSESFMVN